MSYNQHLKELTFELHFSSSPTLTLDRVTLSGSDLTLNNLPASLALAQLLVQARRLKDNNRELPSLSGELATALISELSDESGSFFHSLVGTEIWSEALRTITVNDAPVLLLESSFTCNTTVSITVDGCDIAQANDLLKLEEQIKEAFRKAVDHSSQGNLVSLFEHHLDERTDGITEIKKQLAELTTKEVVFHLSQHVGLQLYAGTNDWQVTWEVELQNGSFVPITTRTRWFWFDVPQENVDFQIRDSTGQKMEYSVVSESSNYRELLIHLPRPLAPFERIKYSVSYVCHYLEGETASYSLCAETITKKLSLTVKGHEGFVFDKTFAVHESKSGESEDKSSSIVISKDNGIETLHWSEHNPKQGEMYRVNWSDANYVPVKVRLHRARIGNLSCVKGGDKTPPPRRPVGKNHLKH